jgi:DNA repair protein RecO (recombination protein O)
MMVVKTKALILRGMPVGDQDRLLTMLSADLGVITVSARGVGRNGNRLAAATQPMMYGEYVLFQGISRYSLNQGEVIASFFDLALEPERYERAVRMLSMSADAGMVPEAASEVLELTLHALHRLMPNAKVPMDPDLVVGIFELKMLQISGLTPHLTGCVRCGTSGIDRIRFSHGHGGFLCETCDPEDPTAVPVSAGVAKAMLYTLCAPVQSLFRFDLAAAQVGIFLDVVSRYAEERWEKSHPRKRSLYGNSEDPATAGEY